MDIFIIYLWPNNCEKWYGKAIFLIEKEVSQSGDAISKELYVEAFHSRDDFTEALMNALDRVDEVEAAMAEGTPGTPEA